MKSAEWFVRSPDKRSVQILSVFAMFFHLVLLFGMALWTKGADFLNNWDSGWFTMIVDEGYAYPSFAFFPLFPMLARGMKFVTGLEAQVSGTLVSVVCIGLFMWIMSRTVALQSEIESGLLPRTNAALFMLFFTPAAYVFFTHHTESLFLLVSFVACVAAFRQHYFWAGVFTGLAALTKNQGVFLGCGLFILTFFSSGDIKHRLKACLSFGIPAAIIASLWPLYLYLNHGDPFLFVETQSYWRPEHSTLAYFRTFAFANPWQNTGVNSIIRYVAFFVILISSVAVLLKKNKALGIYMMMFVLVMPMQGEFVGTLRYAAVMFPTIFVGTDFIATKVQGKGLVLFLFLAMLLSGVFWYQYSRGQWAY